MRDIIASWIENTYSKDDSKNLRIVSKSILDINLFDVDDDGEQIEEMHCRSKVVPSFGILIPFEADQVFDQLRVENGKLVTVKTQVHDLDILSNEFTLIVKMSPNNWKNIQSVLDLVHFAVKVVHWLV